LVISGNAALHPWLPSVTPLGSQDVDLRTAGEVETMTENDSLMIPPVETTRAGWDIAFQEMAHRNDDQLLDESTTISSEWDESEWEW
jgi:hypothetical protein